MAFLLRTSNFKKHTIIIEPWKKRGEALVKMIQQ